MSISKLFEVQRKLDERIAREKGLEGQNLLDKKILALQVELGELANEWRGFKYWSNDQEPRTTAKCETCDGLGNDIYFTGSYDNGNLQECSEPCEYCDGTGDDDSKNPLLEEYVDCLHFILSIGLELGYTFSTVAKWRSSNVNEQFNDIFHAIATLYESIKADWEDEERQDCFSELAKGFLGLGGMLGFTPEQIESAYYEKNAENHRRQEVGY